MAGQFEKLRAERDRLGAELAAATAAGPRPDPAAAVEAAMAAFDRLPELTARAGDAAAVQDLLGQVGVKLYLRFRSEARGR